MAVEKADEEGGVCDSLALRAHIMTRVREGEITLEEGKAKLKQAKAEGKRQNIPTRAQVWNRS